MTKADLILSAIIAVAAAIAFFFFQAGSSAGAYAQVFYDGSLETVIALDGKEPVYCLFAGQRFFTFTQKEWQEAELTAGEGESLYNVFRCLDGQVEMIQSSCPDQICVHHKPVSRTGESIICLPHKIVIEITGLNDGQGLDGVVY